MSTLREQVLQNEVRDLKRALALLNQSHFGLLTTIVYYCGGELTLRREDWESAKGLLLTESVDPQAESRTWKTKRVGFDGGDEVVRGGLLPPHAGSPTNGASS